MNIASLQYDIAKVDRSLRGYSNNSGNEVAKQLKEKHLKKPIIIISCCRYHNLDYADYYLQKPFKFDELLDTLKLVRIRFFGHTLADMDDTE